MTANNQTAANISKWMPVWIGDIRRETIGRPPEFTGMYLNLMMAAWENGGQLDDDESQLFRISGATAQQWAKHRQALANLFVPRNGVWSHNLIRTEDAGSDRRCTASGGCAGTCPRRTAR